MQSQCQLRLLCNIMRATCPNKICRSWSCLFVLNWNQRTGINHINGPVWSWCDSWLPYLNNSSPLLSAPFISLLSFLTFQCSQGAGDTCSLNFRGSHSIRPWKIKNARTRWVVERNTADLLLRIIFLIKDSVRRVCEHNQGSVAPWPHCRACTRINQLPRNCLVVRSGIHDGTLQLCKDACVFKPCEYVTHIIISS